MQGPLPRLTSAGRRRPVITAAWLLAGAGAAALAAVALPAPAQATRTPPTQVTRTLAARASGPNAPIKHVIEIMIENHTFDNLFGSFPGADGIPANASFLNPSAYYDSAPNVSPVQATPNEGDVQGAINNSRVA